MSVPQLLKEIDNDSDMIPIYNFVNRELLNELINEFEVLENAAAKALYFTGNRSLEKAIEWIERNQDSKDFDKPMFVSLPNKLLGNFDQLEIFPQQNVYKQETKTMKEFRKLFAENIEKWKDKIEVEGEVQQLTYFTKPIEKKSLESLLKEREAWENYEKLLTEIYRDAAEVNNLKENYNPNIEHYRKKHNKLRKENYLDIFNIKSETSDESGEESEEEIDMKSESKDSKKSKEIQNLILNIKKENKALYSDFIKVFRKILTNLKNNLISKLQIDIDNEDYQNYIKPIEKACQILTEIGYIESEGKLKIDTVDKNLVNELLEFIIEGV